MNRSDSAPRKSWFKDGYINGRCNTDNQKTNGSISTPTTREFQALSKAGGIKANNQCPKKGKHLIPATELALLHLPIRHCLSPPKHMLWLTISFQYFKLKSLDSLGTAILVCLKLHDLNAWICYELFMDLPMTKAWLYPPHLMCSSDAKKSNRWKIWSSGYPWSLSLKEGFDPSTRILPSPTRLPFVTGSSACPLTINVSSH